MSISPEPTPVPNSSGIRITALETVIPDHVMPGLLLLRIHTDAGVIGHGETYYAPHGVAALLRRAERLAAWRMVRALTSDEACNDSRVG